MIARALLALLPLLLGESAGAQLAAFPGAKGFGANTVAGRGPSPNTLPARIVEVTNLSDGGVGSFRWAVTHVGSGRSASADPRIVIFKISGTIGIDAPIMIVNPYLTIAGQTAPNGGVALRRSRASYPSNRHLVDVRTHDVAIRHLRFRPGRVLDLPEQQALSVNGAYNVVIDHCSFSWGTDDTVAIWGTDVHDVTLQYSIVSEALMKSNLAGTSRNFAVDRQSSRGLLLGSSVTGRISVHHSLFAHSYKRAPSDTSFGVVDFVNNVVYNEVFPAAHVADCEWANDDSSHPCKPLAAPTQPVKLNYVNNYLKRGPLDPLLGAPVPAYLALYHRIYTPARPGMAVYSAGTWRSLAAPGFEVLCFDLPADGSTNGTLAPCGVAPPYQFVSLERHAAPAIGETSAQQAYLDVIAQAGATNPTRDAVDARIVNDVLTGGPSGAPYGGLIYDPAAVGGWPDLRSGGSAAYADNDGDGMSNAWEAAFAFDQNDAFDGPLDADADGYTNVEEFLNGTAPKPGHCGLLGVEPLALLALGARRRARTARARSPSAAPGRESGR